MTTTTTNLNFFVTCNHKVETYRRADLLTTVSIDRQGEGNPDRYYVSMAGFGCSKSYATPQGAIRGMLQDHACFDIVILPQVQTVVPAPKGWDSVDGGATLEAPIGTIQGDIVDEQAEARARGQLDRLAGNPAYYGCHVGMRSTRQACADRYHAGWKEIDHALTHGDEHGLGPVPPTLNGYPVIKVKQHAGRAYVTVMCQRDEPHELPYIVCTWWPALGSTWSWGHYCEDRDSANEAFAGAAARNAVR